MPEFLSTRRAYRQLKRGRAPTSVEGLFDRATKKRESLPGLIVESSKPGLAPERQRRLMAAIALANKDIKKYEDRAHARIAAAASRLGAKAAKGGRFAPRPATVARAYGAAVETYGRWTTQADRRFAETSAAHRLTPGSAPGTYGTIETGAAAAEWQAEAQRRSNDAPNHVGWAAVHLGI